MSEAAVKWAGDQIAPCGRSKALLLRLAAFADDEGVCWASIPTLAEDQQCSDRQLQRLMRKLVTAELMVATGQFRYRNIPYYQLALHKVGELEQRRAQRQAAAARARFEARKTRSKGDADVTDQARTVTSTSPIASLNGDIHVTVQAANGDTGVTQRRIRDDKEESADALSACARDGDAPFDRVYEAWKARAPTAVERPRDLAAWRKVVERVDPARLELAAERYLAHCAQSRDRVFSLARWLSGEKWEPFLADRAERAAPSRPTWAGPPEVRAAVVAVRGENFAASWLDTSRWDAAASAIVCPRPMTRDRLNDSGALREALQAAGVLGVVVVKGSGT